jgi:hypothetical protein
MNALKELIKRMGLVKKPQNMAFAFRNIAGYALDMYKEKNYQRFDLNNSFAYLLKNMIVTINNFQSRKSIPEQRWLYENSRKLAALNPMFKEFSKNFEKPQNTTKPIGILPKEPAEVYPRSHKIRNRFSSHSYE